MMTGTRPRSRSRGMTIVAVLVCLVVITLVSGALLKTVLAQHEFARGRERRLQAEWLVESGLQRVRARLDVDREYTGETWSLSAQDLGLPEEGPSGPAAENAAGAAAVVSIAVERVPGDLLRRQVRVQADYPRDAPRRARQSKQMLIDLKPKKAGVAP